MNGWAVDGWALPDEVLRDAPTYTPRPSEIADLELLLSEAYKPLKGFLGYSDLVSLRRNGRLADGTAWPVPVTLEVPYSILGRLDVADPMRRVLILADLEGAPIAALEASEIYPSRAGFGGVALDAVDQSGPRLRFTRHRDRGSVRRH